MFVSETKFVVRYAETDRMGIVHHSNYPVWFEAGRTDFIKKMGMPYSKIEESGFFLPLIGLSCEFKGASRYEDEVIICTSLKSITYTRIVFHYEVYVQGNSKAITMGETEHAWTDSNLKPINIKKHAPEIYSLLQEALQEKANMC